MRYFTRQAHEAISEQGADYLALSCEFDNSAKLYREQLERLLPRLSEAARTFFRDVSLHDGTLLVMRVGDDIDESFEALNTLIVNKRHLLVELQILDHKEENVFALRYDRIHRIVFDFPTEEPWFLRFDHGANPIDYWMAHELTPVNDIAMRHEILFSSGATFLIEFESITVDNRPIEGRDKLPYLDEPE